MDVVQDTYVKAWENWTSLEVSQILKLGYIESPLIYQ